MLTTIETLFANLAATGYKKPHLRAEGFIFKLAPSTGANPGAVYVTRAADGEYLGKIMRGKVQLTTAVKDSVATVEAIAANPQDAALKYGHKTGACAVCGRRLDNKQSVDMGIGPICAEKYGWFVPNSGADDIDWNIL